MSKDFTAIDFLPAGGRSARPLRNKYGEARKEEMPMIPDAAVQHCPIRNIVAWFPFWFSTNYEKYVENEETPARCFHEGGIGCHIRRGKHYPSRRDWQPVPEYLKRSWGK